MKLFVPPETGHRPKARAVNRRHTRYDVYCGRPGPWGNPYRIGPDGDRAAVIAKHKAHIRRRLRSGQLTLEQLAALSGKKLGCWCKPQPCHADYLAQLADAAQSILDTIKLFQKRGATPPAMSQSRRAARRLLAAGKGNINLTPDNWLEIRENESGEPQTILPAAAGE